MPTADQRRPLLCTLEQNERLITGDQPRLPELDDGEVAPKQERSQVQRDIEHVPHKVVLVLVNLQLIEMRSDVKEIANSFIVRLDPIPLAQVSSGRPFVVDD